jgi:hypothetical protein
MDWGDANRESQVPRQKPSPERTQYKPAHQGQGLDSHKGQGYHGSHGPMKEAKKETRQEANPAVNQSPASTDALAGLMAKFNKGLR